MNQKATESSQPASKQLRQNQFRIQSSEQVATQAMVSSYVMAKFQYPYSEQVATVDDLIDHLDGDSFNTRIASRLRREPL